MRRAVSRLRRDRHAFDELASRLGEVDRLEISLFQEEIGAVLIASGSIQNRPFCSACRGLAASPRQHEFLLRASSVGATAITVSTAPFDRRRHPSSLQRGAQKA